MSSLAAAAARNNAAWVDAVARSHGVPARQDGAAWRGDGRMPRFYPNLVTLDPAAGADALLGDPPRGAAEDWGLKDSFAVLDLAPEGFVPLFDAEWLVREPAPTRAEEAGRVTTVEGLGRWTRGWGEAPEDAAIFRPALLEAAGVRFYAVEADGRAVAGIAALVDGEVAGYSNAFGPVDGMAACLAALAADAGPRPLVGYEAGAALRAMVTLGFRPVGALRVWSRDGRSILRAAPPAARDRGRVIP